MADPRTLDDIRSDVKGMTLEQAQEELIKWRVSSQGIVAAFNELNRFRQFAASPEELASKVNVMTLTYTGALELKDREIKELTEMLVHMQEDPLKLDQRFKDRPKANTKH